MNDGKEAVIALEYTHYDLEFMDIQLPELDGYSATRIIREQEQTDDHTTIIALTANAQAEEREKCLSAGLVDYLSKPFTQDALQAMLEKWLPTND